MPFSVGLLELLALEALMPNPKLPKPCELHRTMYWRLWMHLVQNIEAMRVTEARWRLLSRGSYRNLIAMPGVEKGIELADGNQVYISESLSQAGKLSRLSAYRINGIVSIE